jgi:NAD(P)-dependent dehydrogenase (short-subunit alcohol dehydrogenase family)
LIGGTRGVGLGVAKVIARSGGSVTFVGRSQASCDAAMRELNSVVQEEREIVRNVNNNNINNNNKNGFPEQPFDSLIYDLSLLKDLSSLVSQLATRAQQQPDKYRYHYLVLSIGVFPDWAHPLTADGIEKSFAAQILSRTHVLRACERFLVPDARILNVLASALRQCRLSLPISAPICRDG